jgi:2-C-methyl-D-erythritol 4-phosphate cytidylyltransferase
MKAITFDVVIVAGGAGARLGHRLPKAFVELAGMPLFVHALEVFKNHALTDAIILVVPEAMIDAAKEKIAFMQRDKKIHIIKGGKERCRSVQNGVKTSSAEWVMVHDAARPFLSHAVIDAVLEKTPHYDAIITVTPETDTVRTFENDRCKATVDRNTLVRVGTPQLFRKSKLLKSFQFIDNAAFSPTDEAMLMEKMGIPVGIAWGDPLNFKITTKSDFILAEALCAYRFTHKRIP